MAIQWITTYGNTLWWLCNSLQIEGIVTLWAVILSMLWQGREDQKREVICTICSWNLAWPVLRCRSHSPPIDLTGGGGWPLPVTEGSWWHWCVQQRTSHPLPQSLLYISSRLGSGHSPLNSGTWRANFLKLYIYIFSFYKSIFTKGSLEIKEKYKITYNSTLQRNHN